jgi:hypothetical protein
MKRIGINTKLVMAGLLAAFVLSIPGPAQAAPHSKYHQGHLVCPSHRCVD